jgi:hypothetical protein
MRAEKRSAPGIRIRFLAHFPRKTGPAECTNTWIIICGNSARKTLPTPRYEKVGSFTRSFLGTDSKCPPALRHAVKPPTITNVLKPLSCNRCATRALVASRAQVQ